MRGRSHSGVRLDQLMLIVEKTIMVHQDPVTGLFANNAADFPGIFFCNFLIHKYKLNIFF